MKKYSKIIAMILVVSIMLPGIVQASPTSKDVPSIRRIAGPGRVETSVEASKIAFKNGEAKNVVLAGYSGEVDALAGTLLANTKNAPLILTRPKAVPKVVKEELKRLGAKNIYILGGESVISRAVFEDLKKNYTVKRIAGSNRVKTAAAVAKEVGGKTNHIFLAKGYDIIADALAAGPVSAIKNMPILLTRTDRIADETLEAMKDLGVTHVTIVGGETAVSKVVENKLKKYKVDRIEGSNREKTAVAIAQKYFTNPTNLIIANGYVYADALVGGYLGAKMNAPILLTSVNKTSTDTIDYLGKNTETAYLLGGQNAVNLEVYSRIEKIIEVSRELAEAKADAKIELEIYINIKDYTMNVEDVKNAINDGKVAIDLVSNLEEVAKALEDAKVVINSIESDAKKLESATSVVVKAEKSNLQADVDAAKKLVDALPKTEAKDGLLSRLGAVQAEIDKVKDEAAAKLVEDQIEALPAVDKLVLEDKETVEAARTAYEGLTEDQQELVKNLDKLEVVETKIDELQAAADKLAAAIKAAEEAIVALPIVEDVKIADKGEVAAAKDLVAAVKALDKDAEVEGEDLIADLEAKIAELEAAATEAEKVEAATEAVVKAEGTKEQDDVDAAEELVNVLKDSEAKIDLENRLEAVQEEINKVVADKVAAKLVEDQIKALPAVGKLILEDKEIVEAARTAYEGLTEDQQELVKNLDKLEAAGTKIDELQAAADKLAAAIKAAEEAIVALPKLEDVKIADKADVTVAKALVEAVKELDKDAKVEGKELIAELEAKIKELEEEAIEAKKLEAAKEGAKKAIDEVVLEIEGMTEESVEAAQAKLAKLRKAAKEAVDALETVEEVQAYEFDASEAEDLLVTVEDQAAAEKVNSLIESLPIVEEIEIQDKEQIKAAINEYEALTTTQKALVENLEKLELAENRILEIEDSILISKIVIVGEDIVLQNETLQLDVGISPSGATNNNVLWSVEEVTGRAKIDENGLLTGLDSGLVTVKVHSQDGSGILSKKEINIAVPVTIESYNGSHKDIIIPSLIEGDKINKNEYKGFVIKESIKKNQVGVVTNIENHAFRWNKLTSVEIPDSVIKIGHWSFSNNELTSIKIPESVTNIGISAFQYNKLESVTIPDNITKISPYAFFGNSITSLVIPKSVVDIGYGAFANNKLTSITIPESVTNIGDGAFTGNKLTSITIPESVTNIGDNAFEDNELTSITIAGGITSIGSYAFIGNKLTSITIPEGVTSIGSYAFGYNNVEFIEIYLLEGGGTYIKEQDGDWIKE